MDDLFIAALLLGAGFWILHPKKKKEEKKDDKKGGGDKKEAKH
jgi:hypothetical protein